MARARLLAAVTSLILLAACGDEPEGDDARRATGEVLEGTISDEMLPLGHLRSKPPLLDPESEAPAGQQEAAPQDGADAAEPPVSETTEEAAEGEAQAAD